MLGATVDTRYAIGKCDVCGRQTMYYVCRANGLPVYCPECRAKRRGKDSRNIDDDCKFRLIYDPRGPLRDEWGSPAPVFKKLEIQACIQCGKYDKTQEYPFVPGCRFVGERGALYGVYVANGKLCFGRILDNEGHTGHS